MAPKKKILFSWFGLVAAMFFLPLDQAKAAEQCTDSYGALGYACNLPGDCDESDSIKAKTNEAVVAKKVGEAKGAVIAGVCADKNKVCCIKKAAPASGGAGGGTGTTPAGEDGGTAGCNAVCQWIKANYGKPKNPDGTEYKGPIPDCAFSGQCREVNDVVQILINQGKLVFGIIGMVALAAFVYGGFLMVFSFGSSDKVQQGKDVMVAAVIGIIIVFSAYLLVNFILNALGVSPEFQAIK